MRLSKVNLAGFKSFVDPTTFVLSGNLNGIVGPNGCGKSNIIDAVRWVMGESSAKQLRGESMTDVIFNGSSSRKPAGQATIELVFDNTIDPLGGQWASYSEISIKRLLSRDGTSTYFLNGAKCRRKDITDIFLGTGLGPRSYAIIEQGMISRVIESRPEDLRHFFEEAAGISKYKERRKETEIRIEHTRENLNRLLDVREELNVQHAHLFKQAQAAKKYQNLKTSQRCLNFVALSLEQREINDGDQIILARIDALQIELDLQIKMYNAAFELIEKNQSSNMYLNQSLFIIDEQYHSLKENTIRLDAQIKTCIALSAQKEKSQQEWQQRMSMIKALKTNEQADLDEIEVSIESIAIAVEDANTLLQDNELNIHRIENNSSILQSQYIDAQSRLNTLEKERDVIKNSLLYQENHQLDQARLLSKIKLQCHEPDADLDQSTLLEASLLTSQKNVVACEHAILNFETLKVSTYQQLASTKTQISAIQTKRSEELGKLTALETLQLSLDKRISRQNEHTKSALHHAIKVEAGYERAIEASLKHWLMIPVVHNCENEFGFSGLIHTAFTPKDLGFYVKSNLGLGSLLSHIKIAEDLHEAEIMRPDLLAHEWIVLKDGTLMGKDWFLPFDETDIQAGIIARVQEIEALKQSLALDESVIDELEVNADTLEQSIVTIESKLKALRDEMALNSEESHKIENKIQLINQSNQHAELERTRLNAEIHDIEQNLIVLQEDTSVLRGRLEEVLIEIEDSQEIYAQLLDAKTHAEEQLKNAKSLLKTLQNNWLSHSKSLDTFKIQADAKKIAMTRLGLEFNELNEKLQQSLLDINHNDQSEDVMCLEEQLALEYDQIDQLETQKNKLSLEIKVLSESLLSLQAAQKDRESKMIEQREKLQTLNLSKVELITDKKHLEENLNSLKNSMSTDEIDQGNIVLAEKILAITQHNNGREILATFRKESASIEVQIEKIGAVNLMAIEECTALEVRKSYLEEQDKDLNDALTMLENAIKNIDQETRGLFKATFDQVNTTFKSLFPTLFGGGEAGLTLTDDDVLIAGVNIIAKPPGKRPGTIHLLSGGEKALTAVALVFAIFNLNPAPFCMLDEVDAPLDDANVERYGNLLKQMSSTVQFIFITHNKGAMAIADYLIGVTMTEPGVSRLVSVDMEQAIAFVE